MTPLQTLEIRAAEIRARLSAIGGMTDLNDETRSELDTLKREYQDNDAKQVALKIAGDAPKPESTEGGRRVSILKWPEGALLNLG